MTASTTTKPVVKIWNSIGADFFPSTISGSLSRDWAVSLEIRPACREWPVKTPQSRGRGLSGQECGREQENWGLTLTSGLLRSLISTVVEGWFCPVRDIDSEGRDQHTAFAAFFASVLRGTISHRSDRLPSLVRSRELSFRGLVPRNACGWRR